MFENQNKIRDLGISPISIVEEIANEIRDKSNVVCKFYKSAEDVPDCRELSSEKKNLIVFDDLLLETKHMWIVLCQTKIRQRWLFLAKLFQASTPNNQREREFHMFVFQRPEEP